MRYEILGQLRVVDEHGASSISTPRTEVLLAALLTHANQVVSASQLIAEIWGAEPPKQATAGLHVYVSQLRKFLRRPGRPGSPIATRAPGYILRTAADELDFHSFLWLVNLGRGHLRDGDDDRAVNSLDRALSLWRGPVFGDLRGGPAVQGLATWLTEARLECTEMVVEARLRLGRHAEMISHLYGLITEYPLREVFYRQLMLALHRTQRRADALHVYRIARWNFIQELGQEPGRALQGLYQAILVGEAIPDLLGVA